MSAQNRETLKATIYNLSDITKEAMQDLATMTDKEIEDLLNDILKRGN